MSSPHPSFPLAHASWIPARRLVDGAGVELGILRALGTAHELAGLSADLPTQNVALTRMLVSVLGRAVGPPDTATWRDLWEAEKLPVQAIADYLATHADRLDLLHPQTPFMQVADLRTEKDAVSELSKLIADVPNGAPVFTTRFGGQLTLSLAEAARWVVHCHSYDVSGIKSGAVGDDRVRGGRGYPIGLAWTGQLGSVLLEGASLKETLLLNLVPRDHPVFGRDPAVDVPTWERPPLGAAAEKPDGRPPTGPMDLFTWPSRRLRLFTEGDRVTGVLIANGERITPQNRFRDDPHTAWRRSENQERQRRESPVYMPRTHDPDRAVWRGLASILPGATARDRPSGEPAPSLPPGIVEWLAELVDREVLPYDHEVRFRTVGMIYGSNDSVVADVVDDVLQLRALLARRDAVDLATVVTDCVTAAEKACWSVGALAGDLALAAGGVADGPRSRAREQAFAQLDGPFRTWLAGIGSGSDVGELQESWERTVHAIVLAEADDLLRDLPPACWAGRTDNRAKPFTAAQAEARFWKNLRGATPLAFLDPASDATGVVA